MSHSKQNPILGQAETHSSAGFGRDTSSILTHEVNCVPKRLEPRENSLLAKKLAQAGAHVKDSHDFHGYLAKVDPERAEKLRNCASWLLFHEYVRLGEVKLASGIFCQQPLLCGFCAAGRAARQASSVAEKLEHVQQQNPQLVPYMVTLTMKSQPELLPMVVKFWESWNTMRMRRTNAIKGKNSSVMGLMDGGVMAGEAKRGSGGLWHYHGHGLFLASVYRYQPVWERLKREWSDVLGQTGSSVQFEPVADGGTKDAVREVIKYACKWTPGAHDDRWESFQALTRRRRIKAFGCMHGVKLPEEVADDLTDYEAEEFIAHAVAWGQKSESYYSVPYAQRVKAFDDFNEGK